jgi:hypothetical protein
LARCAESLGHHIPIPVFADSLKVEIEYPRDQSAYPVIIVAIDEEEVMTQGFLGYYLEADEFGDPIRIDYWRVVGQIRLEVHALNPIDRDKIVAGLTNLFAFGHEMPSMRNFYTEIVDVDWIALQILFRKITTSGDSAPSQAYWGEPADLVYTKSLSFPFLAELYSNPDTGGLVTIENINLYPYRPDQAVPTGASDPAPWWPASDSNEPIKS